MYTIDIVRKNGSLTRLGTVTDQPSLNYSSSKKKVNQINMLICNLICNYEKLGNDKVEPSSLVFKHDDVKSRCYSIHKCRKFTLFFFLHSSKSNKRHVCYISNKVNHSGYGIDKPSKNELIDLMIMYFIDNPSYLMNTNPDEYQKKRKEIVDNFGV
jgi:hypothetical protein